MPVDHGVVDLCLPSDWSDLLLPDDVEALLSFAALVRQAWPHGPAEVWEGCCDLLMEWRRTLSARGAISHGLVEDVRPDGTPVRWQVITSVVPLPALSPDVDVCALLAELVRAKVPDVRHVETYGTDMGLGVGLIAEQDVLPPAGLERLAARGPVVTEATVRVGLAAALACEPGATVGLLVVGVCLAPEQVWELAGLVGIMAGRSRVRPSPAGPRATQR
jgi:hypothetical protein